MKFTYDTKDDDRECVAYLHSGGSMFFNCNGVYNGEGTPQGAVFISGNHNPSRNVRPNGTGDLNVIIKNDGNRGHKFYKGDSVTITF